MVMYKLRAIANSSSNSNRALKVMGLTIPDEVAMFFSGCQFSIEKSGTCIMCSSGTSNQPTKEEIETYTFDDCKI